MWHVLVRKGCVGRGLDMSGRHTGRTSCEREKMVAVIVVGEEKV